MIAELVAFLTARLTEDDTAARACCRPRQPMEGGEVWSVEDCVPSEPDAVPSGAWVVTGPEGEQGVGLMSSDYRAQHIARHDPARVVADVNAKLRLVDAYLTTKAEQDAIATRMTDALSAGDVPAREDAGLWRKTEARLEALEFPLMLAALPYWDHLEYDERWKP